MEKAIHRVFKYLEFKNIKHTRFEKIVGLSNGYLNTQRKRNANLGEEVLNKIIDYCQDLNPTWLLTGKGDMTFWESDLKAIGMDPLDRPITSPEEQKKEFLEFMLQAFANTYLSDKELTTIDYKGLTLEKLNALIEKRLAYLEKELTTASNINEKKNIEEEIEKIKSYLKNE